jgi:hypothetical protein
MKRNIARTTLLIAVAALCMSSAPAVRAAEHCSNAKAAGKWALTLTGTLILPTGPVPAAATASGTFDANGNIVSGTEARNVGGDFAYETLTGSWTVNPDCTGTLTVYAYENGQLVRTSVLAIVFVDDLRKVRMVQESLTLPNGTPIPVVITADGNRLFPED